MAACDTLALAPDLPNCIIAPVIAKALTLWCTKTTAVLADLIIATKEFCTSASRAAADRVEAQAQAQAQEALVC